MNITFSARTAGPTDSRFQQQRPVASPQSGRARLLGRSTVLSIVLVGGLIALRFASDDEVVELAKQALEGNLDRKQIKERIKVWRADDFRV